MAPFSCHKSYNKGRIKMEQTCGELTNHKRAQVEQDESCIGGIGMPGGSWVLLSNPWEFWKAIRRNMSLVTNPSPRHLSSCLRTMLVVTSSTVLFTASVLSRIWPGSPTTEVELRPASTPVPTLRPPISFLVLTSLVRSGSNGPVTNSTNGTLSGWPGCKRLVVSRIVLRD
jgi:hypothetical protein